MTLRTFSGIFALVLFLAAAPSVFAQFERVDALTLASNEGGLWSVVIDNEGQFAYFGAQGPLPGSIGRIVKIDLENFENVDSIALLAVEGTAMSAVIDPAGEFAYFGTSSDPGRIIKVDLATFERVGSITLEASEGALRSAVIDPTGTFAYFGTNTSGFFDGTGDHVIKINLETFERVDAITLLGNEDELLSAVISPDGAFAYFGAQSPLINRGRIVKIDLATFERVDAVVIDSDADDYFTSSVISPDGAFAYFGTSSSPARVVKVDLNTFEIVETITLETGENNLGAAVIAPNGAFAFFGTFTIDNPAQIVQIDLRTFTRVAAITLESGETRLRTAAVTPDGEFAYFGTWTEPGQVIKIKIPVIRYVNGATGSDSGPCYNAGSPCATISYAIAQAEAGNIIQIADGVYTESITVDKNLTLNGESETGTILQAHAAPGMATSRVITINGASIVEITDLTVRHGVASGSGNSGSGGGIQSLNAPLTLTNVTVSENQAATWAGGLTLTNADATLTNVTFSGNQTEGDAGGMSTYGSSPLLRNVRFIGNSSGGVIPGSGAGGGLQVGFGSPTLINVVFTGNTAGLGGGLNMADASATLINVTFSGNSASFAGGAILNQSMVSLTLINSILWGNTGALAGNEIMHFDESSFTEGYYSLYSDGPENITIPEGGFICDEGCLTIDPLFADADLHLGEDSSAIDAGDPDIDLGLFPTSISGDPIDLAGNLRVSGDRIDLGAYEVHGPIGPIAVLNPSIDEGIEVLLVADQSTVVTLTISNDGDQDLTFEFTGAPAFVTNINPMTGTLVPGKSADVTLTFDATGYGVGTLNDLLLIATNEWAAELRSTTYEYPVTMHVEGSSGLSTRYVNGFTGSDAGACTNPASPCATIGYAIAQAGEGNTIQIANGTYTESITIDKDLILHGESEAGTIIQAHAAPGTATSRVITINGASIVEITDLTVRHGVASGSGNSGSGGGIQSLNATLTLTNVTVSENQAATWAGGLNLNHSEGNGEGTLTNVTFSGNQAQGDAGGMSTWGSSPLLRNVRFIGNSSGGMVFGTGCGGGLQLNFGSPTLINVVFTGNTAALGAGMCNMDAVLTLINVTFSNNEASFVGGAIHNQSLVSLTLINSILWGNTGALAGNEIMHMDNSSSTEVYYSLYNDGEMNITVPEGDFTCLEGCLTIDPLFANVNLHLGEDSPAIDTGDPDIDLGLFPTDENDDPIDLAGNLRVFGDRIDMGAYEAHGEEPGVGPIAEFDPPIDEGIEETLEPDQSTVVTLTISNVGDEDLTFEFTDYIVRDGQVTFARTHSDQDLNRGPGIRGTTAHESGRSTGPAFITDVDPAVGTVVPDESINVSITFDATGFDEGTLDGILTIVTNESGDARFLLDGNELTGLSPAHRTTMSSDRGGLSYDYPVTIHVESVGGSGTRYVSATSGVNTGACTNPASPCATIGYAIAQASAGDTIEVADGIYTETITINKDLTLSGESEAGTIIQAHTEPEQPIGRPVTINEGIEVAISNVTIRHGFAFDFGGGILNNGNALDLTNVTISNNFAFLGGGGLYNSGSSGSFRNVTFEDNIAADPFTGTNGRGGCIYNNSSSPEIINAVITRCTAILEGGGIYNTNSSPVLINVTLSQNVAVMSGGGIYNQGVSSPTLTNTIIWGNSLMAGTEGLQIYNDATSSIELFHSLYGNDANDIVEGGGFSATDSITETPLFINVETDFRLAGGSPAVDAGDPKTDLGLFPVNENDDPVDRDGNLRVAGAQIDIGAYEAIGYTLVYNDGGGVGWRMLSSLMAGATVQDLAGSNLVRGLDDEYPGGDLNLYLGYTGDNDEEDPHRGFTPATVLADALEPGKGFIWYLFDENYTPPETNGTSQSYALPFNLTFSGSPVVENHQVTFTEDDRSSMTDDGFYLIGNPYAEAYNVRGIAPSTGGYSMTYHHWDATTAAYVQLSGLNDDEADVAAGFFMQFGHLPTLPVTITFGPPGSGPPEPPGDAVQHFTARFELSGELVVVYDGSEYPMDVSDRNAQVVFAENGTDGFDMFDAGKLTPLSYYWANIALLGMQGDEMVRRAIESRPLPLEAVTIPMAFSTFANGLEAGGEFTITMVANDLGSDWQVTLIDLETDELVNLLTDSHTFIIESQPAIDTDQRFEIVFIPPTVSGDSSGDSYIFGMEAIWPNPTISTAQVAFSLETAGEITLDVFDVLGRRVTQIANGEYGAGRHVLPMNTNVLASGVYVVRLTAGSQTAVQRVTVAR